MKKSNGYGYPHPSDCEPDVLTGFEKFELWLAQAKKTDPKIKAIKFQAEGEERGVIYVSVLYGKHWVSPDEEKDGVIPSKTLTSLLNKLSKFFMYKRHRHWEHLYDFGDKVIR